MARSLPRALELCRQHGVPWFHFSTNLMSMTPKLMEKILEVEMPMMTVSVDGATKATFEKIRPPAKWEHFLAKFDLVNQIKQAHGSRFPQLSATAVLMRSNIEEMPDLVRLMRSKGVDYMNFVHMALIGGLGVENETMLKYPGLCNQTLERVQKVAAEVGMQVTLPIPLQEEIVSEARGDNPIRAQEGAGNALQAPTEHCSSATMAEYLNHKNREFNFKVPARDHHNRLCYFPWYYIHINPDGTVFPCGCWFEFSSFGSFKTQSFREIWTGPAYQKLRREHLTARFRDVCANCSVAVMGRPDVTASFSHRAKIRRERLAPV
jgi:radical SAM protein with 4Fe4S-binding SPASM domain